MIVELTNTVNNVYSALVWFLPEEYKQEINWATVDQDESFYNDLYMKIKSKPLTINFIEDYIVKAIWLSPTRALFEWDSSIGGCPKGEWSGWTNQSIMERKITNPY